MNSQPSMGVPDLRLSGDFYSEFVFENQGNEFYFGSSDPKTGYLVDKYGEIFGLAPNNMATFVQKHILPGLMQQVKKELRIL